LMAQTFRRGDPVAVIRGLYAGRYGVVERTVHQKSVDQPHEPSAACHVILNTGQVVTVEQERLEHRPPDIP
jgi:ribosomal protein L24